MAGGGTRPPRPAGRTGGARTSQGQQGPQGDSRARQAPRAPQAPRASRASRGRRAPQGIQGRPACRATTEGTFTVTATGFSGTAPTGTARYVRIGKQVTLFLPLTLRAQAMPRRLR